MNDIETIKELYRKYWTYMINKDADGLRSIMSDDYHLMHMTGVRQSADVFIKGLLDGTFNYYSAEHDAIDVKVTGDTAVMVGKSRVLEFGDAFKFNVFGFGELRGNFYIALFKQTIFNQLVDRNYHGIAREC